MMMSSWKRAYGRRGSDVPPASTGSPGRLVLLLACLCILGAAGIVETASAQARMGAERTPGRHQAALRKPDPAPTVYLLRGGAGGALSTGLDQIATTLRKRGIEAMVAGHGAWRTLANRIIEDRAGRRPRPVVLIGHSLGANSIISMSRLLQSRNVRVAYMVSLAATAPQPVPSNVRRVTNYYFETAGWGEKLVPEKGFRGVLENRDFSSAAGVSHFNIDDQPAIQSEIVRKVIANLGS
jgi:thioesterase domain-containing protein